MPSHYLLTTCLLSMCDLVVLLYVVRRTRHTLYIERSHHYTVALTWHSSSHGAVPGVDHWEFVGDGIATRKVGKLRRLGCVGLHRVRLVMWLAKRG